jgi:hypothetical protein
MKLKKLAVLTLMGAALSLSGCSAIHTAITHRNLEVKTQMSSSIFLPPSSEKTVYVQVKNTSDKDMSAVNKLLIQDLHQKGYTIVQDPNKAYYWVQVNILKADKMKPSDAMSLLSGGYGSSLSGALAGVAAAAAIGQDSSEGLAAGGLLGGAASLVTDSLVTDVNYSVITDVQISVKSNQKITTTTKTKLSQGTGTVEQQNVATQGNRVEYRTRVLSSADKVNLDFKEAQPKLENELANSIANIL